MDSKLLKSHIVFLQYYATGDMYVNDEGLVNVDGNFTIMNSMITEIPFQFGTVKGNFSWTNGQLISLKGCPNIVEGNFNYSGNSKLVTLHGGPKRVNSEIIHSAQWQLPRVPNEQLGLSDKTLRLWWSSGLELDEFKEEYYGAIELLDWDL